MRTNVLLGTTKLRILQNTILETEDIDYDSDEERAAINAHLSLRDLLFRTLSDTSFNKFSYLYTIINITAILASTGTFLIGSFPDYRQYDQDPASSLNIVEMTSVAIFSFDYLARFILTRQNRVTFWLGTMNIIDLLAIIPSYVELVIDSGSKGIGALVVIRILRLFRVFRLAKMMKYSKQLPVLLSSINKSIGGFAMGAFSIIMFLILWASAIFYAETSYCVFDLTDNTWKYENGDPTSFQSIPHSLWWTIVTMCTVGYGDTYPVTQVGKLVASFVMVSGALVLAFPLTILSGNFMAEWTAFLAKEEKNTLKKWEKDFKKVLKKSHLLEDDKDIVDLLPPPPNDLLNLIWDELLALKNGIDTCNGAIESVKVQTRKIDLLMKQLDVSVKLVELDRREMNK